MAILKKVLIVDDSFDFRSIIKTLVREFGHEVIEAQDGYKAVEMTIQHSPDLILMDLAMPLMDGVAATKMIRGMVDFTDTPIIAFSAFGNALQDEALQAGMNEVVAKPFDLNNLRPLINQYLY